MEFREILSSLKPSDMKLLPSMAREVRERFVRNALARDRAPRSPIPLLLTSSSVRRVDLAKPNRKNSERLRPKLATGPVYPRLPPPAMDKEVKAGALCLGQG